MASKGQLSGMAGVYFTAGELSKIGFIVSPTSRNAQGIDLLISNQNGTRTWSIQVKTNSTGHFSFWLLGKKNKKLVSNSLFYVFVDIGNDRKDYFIVPSKVVSRKMIIERSKSTKSIWYSFKKSEAQKYLNKWSLLGNPNDI